MNLKLNKSLTDKTVNSEIILKKGTGVAASAMASQEPTGTKRKFNDNIQRDDNSAKYYRQTIKHLNNEFKLNDKIFIKPTLRQSKPNLTKATRNASVTRSNPDLRTNDISQPDNEASELPKNPAKQRPPSDKVGISLSNSYDNLSDPYSQNEAEMLDATQTAQQQKAKAPNKKRIKPPPLMIQNQSIKKIAQILKNAKMQDDSFTLSEMNSQFTSLYSNNMEDYDQITSVLEKEKIERFTYTPKNKKLKTRVLKGVKGGYDEEDVKKALIEKKCLM